MQLSEVLPLKFRISCRLPHGRGLSGFPEWQKGGRAYSMLELISSKLCTSDLCTWPQYTFGLSLFVVSMSRFSFSDAVLVDSRTSSMPSNNAVVQTDAREPTDVLANALPAATTGADVPMQVVVVPSPLSTIRIPEKHISRFPHYCHYYHNYTCVKSKVDPWRKRMAEKGSIAVTCFKRTNIS